MEFEGSVWKLSCSPLKCTRHTNLIPFNYHKVLLGGTWIEFIPHGGSAAWGKCLTRSYWLSHFKSIASTYRNQSTAMMSVMSSVGRPTDVSTITIVTNPAWGIPAAPILAAVAVILMGETYKKKRQMKRSLNGLHISANETCPSIDLWIIAWLVDSLRFISLDWNTVSI